MVATTFTSDLKKGFSHEELLLLVREYGLDKEWQMTDEILLRLMNTPFQVLEKVKQTVKDNPADFRGADSDAFDVETDSGDDAITGQALALTPQLQVNPEPKQELKPFDAVKNIYRIRYEFKNDKQKLEVLAKFYDWILKLDSQHAYEVAAGLAGSKLAKHPRFAAIIAFAYCLREGHYNEAARNFVNNLPGSSAVKMAREEARHSQGVVASPNELLKFIQEMMQPRPGAVKHHDDELHPQYHSTKTGG